MDEPGGLLSTPSYHQVMAGTPIDKAGQVTLIMRDYPVMTPPVSNMDGSAAPGMLGRGTRDHVMAAIEQGQR